MKIDWCDKANEYLEQLEAAKQRELELLAVIEKQHEMIKQADGWLEYLNPQSLPDDQHRKAFDDFSWLTEAVILLDPKPSQALREHEAKVFADYEKTVSGILVEADHLTTCSERLLAALNKVSGAKERVEVDGTAMAHKELQDAENLVGEYWNRVRCAAYEYRKRAERLRCMAEERRKK